MRSTFALLAASLVIGACTSTSTIEYSYDPRALGPYSSAVRFGETVFLAGKVGRDRRSFATEVSSAIDAVEQQLDELGLTLADVLSVTTYLTDMGKYQTFNEIYRERFPSPYPARTCVAVLALPGGAQVEIQAIAALRR